MIIGIALVVDDLRKGPKLVCRYPTSVPSTALNGSEDLNIFHNEYLSISPENFAKFFRPKPTLMNNIIEVTIDDLDYIGYPCSCTDETIIDSSESQLQDNKENTHSVNIRLFHVIVTIVRSQILKKKMIENGHNYNYKSIDKRTFDPNTNILSLEYNLVDKTTIKRLVFIENHSFLSQFHFFYSLLLFIHFILSLFPMIVSLKCLQEHYYMNNKLIVM